MKVFATFTVFLFLSSQGMSNLFCEDTIHINSDNSNAEIMLYCQLGAKYSFCEIGRLLSTRTDQSCTFYKSTKSPSRDQTFIKQKCTSESFIEQIEYKGIAQSDIDCIFRITNLNATGKAAFTLLALNI